MLGEIITQCRSHKPLVHCITNYVTMGDCANLLLGCGASPIMADDLKEVQEITTLCDGLVLNMGTPNPRKLEAMLLAGQAANRLGHPVIFDPVGVGSSTLRRETAQRLLHCVQFAAIRGNASEIATLVQGTVARRGVDVDSSFDASAMENAAALARQTRAVVIVTGDADIVTDGTTCYRVHNGHPMMRLVTGAGCMLSALTGAYIAANAADLLTASLASVCAMGLCGEIAHAKLTPQEGNASYRNYILDAICNLTADELEKGARYDIQS